jgi:hypothetical protein
MMIDYFECYRIARYEMDFQLEINFAFVKNYESRFLLLKLCFSHREKKLSHSLLIQAYCSIANYMAAIHSPSSSKSNSSYSYLFHFLTPHFLLSGSKDLRIFHKFVAETLLRKWSFTDHKL